MITEIANHVFGRENIKKAYHHAIGNSNFRVTGVRSLLLVAIYWVLKRFNIIGQIRAKYLRDVNNDNQYIYTLEHLHHLTNRVFDPPCYKISSNFPVRINVLCPAFDLTTISAGFYGVFAFAKFCGIQGHSVRLILVDKFEYSESQFKKALSNATWLEDFFDYVEVDYCGDRKSDITFSPNDVMVATVWYTAYFAQKLQLNLNKKKFIYLIQDYECDFYPRNSLYQIAKNTYDFDYYAFVSTKPLFNFLKKKEIKDLVEGVNAIIYNNPAILLPIHSKNEHISKKEKNLVLYSRPMVNRNMFELAAMALCIAYEKGIFNNENFKWNFWGMGIGKVSIKLSKDLELVQLPRYSLDEYYKKIGEFDLGISLMASPHPSIVPMDLAGVGCRVITNNFENKDLQYFSNISKNIISVNPTLEDLVKEIKIQVDIIESNDYPKLYDLNYPTSWVETFTDEHRKFLNGIIN